MSAERLVERVLEGCDPGDVLDEAESYYDGSVLKGAATRLIKDINKMPPYNLPKVGGLSKAERAVITVAGERADKALSKGAQVASAVGGLAKAIADVTELKKQDVAKMLFNDSQVKDLTIKYP